MNPQLTGTAIIGKDPELRYSDGGKAWLKLSLGFSSSKKDRQTDTYSYTPTFWVEATLFGKMAENAAESLRAKDEVVASGVLEMETFKYTRGDRAGEQGSKMVLQMAEVALSVRRKSVPREPGHQPANNARAQSARPAPQPAGVGGRGQLDDPFAERD